MRAIDDSNPRFRRDTVNFAVSGKARRWQERSGFVSLRYTTIWSELLAV